MNDYLVISSTELNALCKRVVEAMEDGYFPLGNVTVHEYIPSETEDGQPDRIFYQAMASYKK